MEILKRGTFKVNLDNFTHQNWRKTTLALLNNMEINIVLLLVF